MSSLHIKQRTPTSELFPGAEDIHPILARIYAGRNIKSLDQVEYPLANLVPPEQLAGMDSAVALLVQALDQQSRVMVLGDFDVDGATSTTLAVEVLTAFGFKHVDYLVPDRFKYGYGLTPEIVEVAMERSPDLIVTVDNGIASLSGVEAAHRNGIQVLITDHHLPGDSLPDADAIINPNQPGDEFPSKSLSGVGVIFYLMLAMRRALREQSWFNDARPEPNLANWLDLVALGTVADMVPLDYNNRILVANGLARIRSGKARPGINALLKLANRNVQRLSAIDLGFVLAPRINAAGRLDDMSIGIECLLSQSSDRAMQLAVQLDNLNSERRAIQSDMQAQATAAVESIDFSKENSPQGVCLYDERWHQGVVGLIASQIKDKLNRPAIAFARGEDGNLKGSARSVQGINVRDVLDTVATNHPGLLIKFGGHAMAAGLSIAEDRFEDFAKAFAEEIERLGHDGREAEAIVTDGDLSVDEINIEVAELLKEAGPWGQGFPEPVFDGRFEVVESRVLKEKHLKFVLKKNDTSVIDAIAFNSVNGDDSSPNFSAIHAVYRLDVNEFRGTRKAQLIIEHIQAE